MVKSVNLLNELHRTHIVITELMYCNKWGTIGDNTYYLKTRKANRDLVVNLPDSNKVYWDYGVVVKN